MLKLPGLIDPHVHLRTPGQEYKEDFISGTKAAIAGGFTTILDMPNNAVPITTLELLKQKQETAKKAILCDVGFHFGSLGQNFEEFTKVQNGVTGIKIYLNQTTGGFIVDTTAFRKICERWPVGLPILVHAEADVIAEVIEIGHQTMQNIHICHISSQKELETVIQAKQNGYKVTCGVTPHHLFLTEEATQRLGSIAMMKPTLKPQADVDFLWNHLQDIDIIESDHAPHSLEEKQSDKPPFGVPGLETTLALLLTAVKENKLTIQDITRLCHDGPAKIFNITEDKQTYIEVDENEVWTVDAAQLFTKAKSSPWNGITLTGKVKQVYIRGTKVFENNQFLVEPGFGQIIKNII